MEATVSRSGHLAFYRRPSFILMCIAFGAVLLIDLFVLHISVRTVNVPVFTPIYLLRTLLLAVGSMAMVSTITQAGESAAAQLGGIPKATYWPTGLSLWQQRAWTWVVIVLGIIFPLILILSPRLFTFLALEDGIVEDFEALGYLISSVMMLAMAFQLRAYRWPHRKLSLSLALGGAFILFVMAGEEISWGQRIFDFATPAAFAGNNQHETNLHNFAANTLESIFYTLAVIWLLVIPFINDRTGFFNKFREIELFVPSRFLIFVGVLAVAYNYTKWDVEPIMISFFVAVFVLMHYLRSESHTDEANKAMIAGLLFLVVASQILFLARGGTTARNWDVTEYRELFIPLGYMVYTFDVLLRARRLIGGQKVKAKA